MKILLQVALVFGIYWVSQGIINYVDLIWQNAAAFLTVCVVSMVLTYGATAWAVHLTRRLMERGGKRK